MSIYSKHSRNLSLHGRRGRRRRYARLYSTLSRIFAEVPLLVDSDCFHQHVSLPLTGKYRVEIMGDQTIQPNPESPEIIAFATRMYDAARQGDVAIFEQALPAGLPPNMTNDKGDSLVRSSQRSFPLSLGTLARQPLLISFEAHALDLSRSRPTFPSPPLSWC